MKILQIQDLHVSPGWIEKSKEDVDIICKVAKEQKVDAITIAGDFFHKAVFASNKNHWKDILNIARNLQAVAPVYFVRGTPSHDSPGCYESFIDIGWKELSIGKSHLIKDLLILGIPEITSSFIAASNPDLSKQEIIEKQYDLTEEIFEKYYIPMSTDHTGKSLFVSHGHVSGALFAEKQAPRRSEFMYSESLLKRLNCDWYQFGHLHLEQSFKTIQGGYGGSAHMTWGDCGFKPGFNVVDFSKEKAIAERFYYNRPMRKKFNVDKIEDLIIVNKKLEDCKDLAVWIDIKCDKKFASDFDEIAEIKKMKDVYMLNELSKITLNIQREENSRVSIEAFEACKSIEDTYLLFDPEAKKTILQKVKEAEENTDTDKLNTKPHSFMLKHVILKGSKAGCENGVKEIVFNMDTLPEATTLLTGENGKGKSFLMGFCTPYSEHLPSGVDIKTLFDLKQSEVIREFYDNKDIITQKIVIDPTLAQPTAKYYMSINGKPLENVTGNKVPFDEAVIDIFGSQKMFLACAFRGQEDSKKCPSLERATEPDLRQIFLELSGIDRTGIKDYARDKMRFTKSEMESKLKELDSVIENRDKLSDTVISIETSIADLDKYNKSNIVLKTQLQEKKEQLLTEENQQRLFLDYQSELEKNESNISNTSIEITTLNNELNSVDSGLSKLDEYNKQLKSFDLVASRQIDMTKELEDIRGEYATLQSEYFEKLAEQKKQQDEIIPKAGLIKTKKMTNESFLNRIQENINFSVKKIDLLNEPCEHCGKNSNSAEKQIADVKIFIKEQKEKQREETAKNKDFEKRLKDLRNQYAKIEAIGKPEAPKRIPELEADLKVINKSLEQKTEIENKIRSLEKAKEETANLRFRIEEKTKLLKELKLKNHILLLAYDFYDNEIIDRLKTEINNLDRALIRTATEIGVLTQRIEQAEKTDKLLNEYEASAELLAKESELLSNDFLEWEKIDSAFNPKGIPAMELSLLAPQIDRVANELLNTYSSRYSVEITTQTLDSKGKNLIERFQILVHDNRASEVKNLPRLSGGQKVWISKAVQEAISKVASSRNNRTWLYSIMDEADAALDSDVIVDFYTMLEKSMSKNRKLISITHSSEAKNAIDSIRDITDFFIGDEKHELV